MKSIIAAGTLALLAAGPGMAASPLADIPYDGAPRFEAGDWSIKPRGRLLYDYGYIERPDGVVAQDLGWVGEFRAARLGVEIGAPAGLSAKVEVDFADNYPIFAEAAVYYQATDNLGFTLGHHKNFNTMEEMNSSLDISFLEHAAFTDAFDFQRRVGASVNWKSEHVIADAGLFTQNLDSFEEQRDTQLSYDARVVLKDERPGALDHIGASVHHLEFKRDPGQTTRYRERPQFHATDARFLSTPRFVADRESGLGLEAAAVRGPLHVTGEAYWLQTGNDVGDPEPGFFGAFIEAGYFLTGEQRGYRDGYFRSTKPLRPLGRGGFGAVQVNARYDHLDLSDGSIRGGTQDAYLVSLSWLPTARTRFLVDAGIIDYDDAALPAAGGDRDYSVGTVAMRAQFDF